MPRIALIHALAHSQVPINEALGRAWPAAERMNLLDDSLSADLARRGTLDARMTARFIALADYAVDTGADAILFTCSAFGACIDAVKRRHAGLPVLKPNEAMIDEALATGRRIGLVASFAPTLQSMAPEFPPGASLQSALADGALAALGAGAAAGHDQAVADAAAQLAARGAGVIALAQFSLARAAPAVAARTGLPVLTTVNSAVGLAARRPLEVLLDVVQELLRLPEEARLQVLGVLRDRVEPEHRGRDRRQEDRPQKSETVRPRESETAASRFEMSVMARERLYHRPRGRREEAS